MRSPKLIDEMGKRHGRLTVFGGPNTVKKGASTWTCRCDCGAVKEATGNALRKGQIKSCGCLKRVQSLRYWCGKKHNPLDQVDDDLLY
jgi:hypothetical protein